MFKVDFLKNSCILLIKCQKHNLNKSTDLQAIVFTRFMIHVASVQCVGGVPFETELM